MSASRVWKRTATGTGTGVSYSDPIVLNAPVEPFNLTIQLDGGATTTMTVEYCVYEDVNDLSGAVWTDHSTLTGVTGHQVGNIAFPVTAIRMRLGDTGTDQSVMRALQGRHPGAGI